MILIGGIGVTAGAHRLWTHKAYKAKWQLRIILVVLYASTGMVDKHLYAFYALQDGRIFLYRRISCILLE